MLGFDLTTLVIFLAVGIVAGFLAGKIMKGRGFGVVGDLVVGVLGAIVGGVIFGVLGLSAYGIIGQTVMAVVGAVVLLWLAGMVKTASH